MNCAECGNEITPEIRVDVDEFKNLCHPCYKLKPKHVCVDFDGVLAEYEGWKGPDHLGDPRPGAMGFLQEINRLGFKVIILTTRDVESVYRWSRFHDLGGLIHQITNKKPPALAYIDDRAIIFRGSFSDALTDLKGFVPYWKNPLDHEKEEE